VNGHELARSIIAKHGTDRYPTVPLQALKALEELGELAEAILKGHPVEKVAKEYGDVGLALFELGSKLGLDLGECMAAVVANETRTFA
jgi:NTP pyrophosphatase (non-canonical NTP hydrolase)